MPAVLRGETPKTEDVLHLGVALYPVDFTGRPRVLRRGVLLPQRA